MTEEKWQNLRGMILDDFGIEEEKKEIIEDIPNAYIEYIIFNGPIGKIKLERTVKPVVIDKKTTYSARAGMAEKVDYIYAEGEFSSKFKAYKWNNGDWEEMDASKISNF
ncbi:hypothetical protein ACFL23_01120 [Patescibacteria group bacterium]